jgi:hypothetical protein
VQAWREDHVAATGTVLGAVAYFVFGFLGLTGDSVSVVEISENGLTITEGRPAFISWANVVEVVPGTRDDEVCTIVLLDGTRRTLGARHVPARHRADRARLRDARRDVMLEAFRLATLDGRTAADRRDHP